MINTKKRVWFHIWCIVLAIVLINLPVIFTYFYHDITNLPKAVNGSLDLSGVDQVDGDIFLDGQWEFYWNSFVESEPDKIYTADLMIEVPDSWSGYKVNGKRLSSAGYGLQFLKQSCTL
ncbi:MAG: hypothetical protein K0R15_3033 [Clostridiales bacterium]|nr:hypothetical protein [Clostridiales bacterium]